MTVVTLLDLSAAFDTVDHDILLRRLNISYGIGGTVLRWITSFLSNRTQVVNFAGGQSSQTILKCGVKQGSVFGSILFAMYTADVIRIAQSFGVQVHCYADDIQLYIHCRADEADAVLARLLDCICAIDAWMGSNRLKMDSVKIQMIWLVTRQQLASLHVTLIRLHDGTTVVFSTSVRNLGVLFDNEMSIMAHVNYSITSSCFFICGSYISFGDHSHRMQQEHSSMRLSPAGSMIATRCCMALHLMLYVAFKLF